MELSSILVIWLWLVGGFTIVSLTRSDAKGSIAHLLFVFLVTTILWPFIVTIILLMILVYRIASIFESEEIAKYDDHK